MGKTWDDPNYIKFFNDGAVNFPYLSDGIRPHGVNDIDTAFVLAIRSQRESGYKRKP